MGEVAAFSSDGLFLEAVDLAVPSTTDWSSLSLLLAEEKEEKERKCSEQETPQILSYLASVT